MLNELIVLFEKGINRVSTRYRMKSLFKNLNNLNGHDQEDDVMIL